ncbi:MAG: site-specific integrase [Pseudomonadota bacterium]
MPRYTVKKRADRPDGPYYLFWVENGRQLKRSLGVFEREHAQAIADRENYEDGERRAFGRTTAEDNVTFAAASLAYIDAADSEKERFGRGRFLRKPIELMGDLRARDVDEETVKKHAHAAYPWQSPSTRRRQFYTPSIAVLKHAAKRGWCQPPAIDRPKEPEGRIEFVTPDEAAAIIQSASPHAAPIFEFGFGTGARASDVARLQASDVRLNYASATIRKSKNGKDRRVDLPPRLVAALANAGLPSHGAAFRTPKGNAYIVRAQTGGLFNDALATACKRAGIRIITFHTLRHSWATWFADQSKDLLRLKRLGGWSSFEMVERYAHEAPPGIGLDAARLGWNFVPISSQLNERVG